MGIARMDICVNLLFQVNSVYVSMVSVPNNKYTRNGLTVYLTYTHIMRASRPIALW